MADEVDEVLALISDFNSGIIYQDGMFEDKLCELSKETLAQFIRLMTSRGCFDEQV